MLLCQFMPDLLTLEWDFSSLINLASVGQELWNSVGNSLLYQ